MEDVLEVCQQPPNPAIPLVCLDEFAKQLLSETRTLASLYEAFEPEKAQALSERYEIHYTPKHGSWLNMAEIEIGLLARKCLDRRISSAVDFRSEVSAYLDWKNATPKPISWQPTNEKARVKLRPLYPSI